MTAPHPVFARRGAGVLLPLSSLPGRHGVGDLGPSADALLDWCAEAGLSWWQLLPVGPVGPGDSPYSSPSSFAGEPLYLSLELLAEDGLLDDRDLRGPRALRSGPVDWKATRALKLPRLERAAARFLARGTRSKRALRDFSKRNAGWLPAWLEVAGGDADVAAALQLFFARQWSRLRERARARDVKLLGDLPIFVEASSADVRANPELFRLDARGRPTMLTGVPPDAFSKLGQLWGHPHYRWSAHRADGYRWWTARIGAQLGRFDAVRLDHFIGFVRAWEVKAGARDARAGRWKRSPGRELLTAVTDALGPIPLLAEDLGATTPAVHALRDEFGYPGMRVLQWAFGEGATYDRPHSHPRNAIAYTGTHDNDTTQGWWRGLDGATRERVVAYTGGSAETIGFDLARAAFTSPAHTAIAPAQDFLELGREARTNRPGIGAGNWRWRLGARMLSARLARRVRALVEAADRLPR